MGAELRVPEWYKVRDWITKTKILNESVQDFEFLNPLPAIFGDVHVSLGVHGNAVRLVELAGEMSDAATEMRDDAASFAIDDLDLRVVLIDEIDQRLARIAREIE